MSSVGEKHWGMQSSVATLVKRMQQNFTPSKAPLLHGNGVRYCAFSEALLFTAACTVMANEQSMMTKRCTPMLKEQCLTTAF